MNRRELLKGLVGAAGLFALGDAAEWEVRADAAAKKPAVPAVIDFDNNAVKLTPLTANLRLLTGPGGNIAVLTGSDGTLLVDSGIPPRTRDIVHAVAGLHQSPIATLINTHWHFDHTGGNAFLGSKGVRIIGHDNVRQRLAHPQILEFMNLKFPASPKAALPVETFSTTAMVYANGEEIYLEHTAPAHTDSDSIIHFRQANVIHAGDLFFNGFYPFIDYSSGGWIGGMIAGLDRVLALADTRTRIIPGHGSIGTSEDVLRLRTLLSTVSQRIEPLIQAHKTEDQIVAAKPTQEFDPQWGKVLLSGEQFTRDVVRGIVRHNAH